MKYILVITLTILFFSCKTGEKNTKTSSTTNKEVKKSQNSPSVLKESLFLTMERTPCFGKCPAYKITIFNTGNVIFEGYSHTENIGKYSNQLSKSQLKEIHNMMDDIEIYEMKDVYDTEVTDLPSTKIFIVSNGKKKKILDRVDAPATLKQFEKLIDFLVINEKLIQLPTNK